MKVDPEEALPVDPNRRADMRVRADIARTWLAELEVLGWRPQGDIESLCARRRSSVRP
jgi:hypothetical protein